MDQLASITVAIEGRLITAAHLSRLARDMGVEVSDMTILRAVRRECDVSHSRIVGVHGALMAWLATNAPARAAFDVLLAAEKTGAAAVLESGA